MTDIYGGLTADQAEDAARFLAFMEEWPQDAMDAEPDEWARAEHLAAFFRDHGHDVSAGLLARVLRACELFDAVAALPGTAGSK